MQTRAGALCLFALMLAGVINLPGSVWAQDGSAPSATGLEAAIGKVAVVSGTATS